MMRPTAANDQLNWRKDQYVTHAKKPQWGVGKIVDSDSQNFTVFFADSGRRTLMELDAQLTTFLS